MTALVTPTGTTVRVTGDVITIEHLRLVHGEAAAMLHAQLSAGAAEEAADALRRAVPIGLVALRLSTAGFDSGAVQRTLDTFADTLDARSNAALAGLDEALRRLNRGEHSLETATRAALAQLPVQLEQVLAGEGGNVKAAVLQAAHQAQASALSEMRAALEDHSRTVRQALSLDSDGPVQALRRDLLDRVDATRRELGEQMSTMRAMLQAAEAAKAASTKSTRAVGLEWETTAMAIAHDIVTAAGDRFEATGARPAPGGTARSGDGLATVNRAISGPGGDIKIVFEAKKRSRPLTVTQLRQEIETGRQVRDAAAGLVLVPTSAEVPGGGLFARIDNHGFVCAANDPAVVSLVYCVLRELTALLAARPNDASAIDLPAWRSRSRTHWPPCRSSTKSDASPNRPKRPCRTSAASEAERPRRSTSR
jgi:hypothetical protein